MSPSSVCHMGGRGFLQVKQHVNFTIYKVTIYSVALKTRSGQILYFHFILKYLLFFEP